MGTQGKPQQPVCELDSRREAGVHPGGDAWPSVAAAWPGRPAADPPGDGPCAPSCLWGKNTHVRPVGQRPRNSDIKDIPLEPKQSGPKADFLFKLTAKASR